MHQERHDAGGELLLSTHTDEQWRRRRRELSDWINRPKVRKLPKRTRLFGKTPVDEQLHPILIRLQRAGLVTEFSCAGVSPLDEPVDHSLYAYLTYFSDRGPAESFTNLLMRNMKHRALITYEPSRSRYDVSSFFIGHNRSFCILLLHSAEQFIQESRL
ncbi:hypothetical protein [Paenibacillus glucanolyticus]|jgi:hypothetical protein|uniref:hypothetical protein n=1 Tax=Paenibacillus glucanolyticus TaxID=59843 RepID=UPI00096C8748|nr:hypothetical protein [Paenibacillus glucanolyticus]MPY16043.1 hypothetical protein [Paenibacillus glucanolyticus]OMF75983.1 hypothetical protein BK142_15915 [Paenibacillus glucanolyticus]